MFWSKKDKADDTFTDPRDGKVYKTVKIGEQIWMAENLAFDTETEGCKVYNNDPAYCKKYGRLYDHETAAEARPEGWYLPRYYELQQFRSENSNKEAFKALLGGKASVNSNFRTQYLDAGSCGYWWGYDMEDLDLSGHGNHPHYSLELNKSGSISIRGSRSNNLLSVRYIQYPAPNYGSFTDPGDGRTYKTIKIGNQVWMAENLAYDADGSRCYDDDPDNAEIYGRLYDWETAKRACPEGWHLPSMEEWGELVEFVGKLNVGYTVAGRSMYGNGKNYTTIIANKLIARDEEHDSGRDVYGFAALLGGFGRSNQFISLGEAAQWWSNSAKHDEARIVQIDGDDLCYGKREKDYLLSVRCIQGKSTNAVPRAPRATDTSSTPRGKPIKITTSEPQEDEQIDEQEDEDNEIEEMSEPKRVTPSEEPAAASSGFIKDEVVGMFGDIFEGLGSPISDKKPAGTGNCPKCSGTGQIRVKMESIFGDFMKDKTCPDCNGTGNIKG